MVPGKRMYAHDYARVGFHMITILTAGRRKRFGEGVDSHVQLSDSAAGYEESKAHQGIKGGPPQWRAKPFPYVWQDNDVSARRRAAGRSSPPCRRGGIRRRGTRPGAKVVRIP